MARIAPHAVRPLPFALPLDRSLTRGKLAMRAGFALDRLVAWDRNRGVPAALHLPAGRVVSRTEAMQRFPGLVAAGTDRRGRLVRLRHDRVRSADRSPLRWPRRNTARSWRTTSRRRRRFVDARPRRPASAPSIGGLGREVEIAARVTVNATGSAVDRLLQPLGAPTRMPMLKAMNLVTSREAGEDALGGPVPSGRQLFLVPWRRHALFGTWESERPCEPGDDPRRRTARSRRSSTSSTTAFPSLDLTLADVTLVHRGVVPAAVGSDGRATLEGDEQVRDHADEGLMD